MATSIAHRRLRRPRRAHGRAGFTLMECLIASIVLAVTVSAIATALASGHRQAKASLDNARGARLAEVLMEEVQSLAYVDTSAGASTGSRAAFDQINDVTSYTEGNTIMDQAGTAYPTEFQHYTRTVAVTWGTLSITGLSGSSTGATIVVTVSDKTGSGVWTLTAFMPAP
ncbi:MAG: prepilin-type N-terminal cleavage/methylation domain-containing protein [Planctomycetota bacterium]|nr:prepilin-type N-terminal cleavage/methylation domain-containing protein [Planctomycetota bacterium]